MIHLESSYSVSEKSFFKRYVRVFTRNRSIQRRKMVKWQLFIYHLKQRVCMDWVDKPQNYKDLYGILQLLRGTHWNHFLQKTLKLGWVAFHSVKFQLKCLDFQSNQYKKLVPVLSRFCNWLCWSSTWRPETSRNICH